jgi:hypothetical protein
LLTFKTKMRYGLVFCVIFNKNFIMKNLYFFLLVLCSTVAFGNNILVQNVTTTGNNATNKTIQVQFDLSWDNSWRDAINWDAAWVFMKFKNASGVWQHVQLNTTGFANGTGTANTVQVTSDKVGAWVYRSAQGSGTFNSTTMQLQWNYGLSGLTSVTGLEVRVYAVEMVYVPQGDFNCAGAVFSVNSWQSSFSYRISPDNYSYYNDVRMGYFYAPGQNFPVINKRLSPPLTYNDGALSIIRIKGDVGIDSDNDGSIDNTLYPIGYKPFYIYKFEMTEQQYADFLNTLTTNQITNLGIAGDGITLSNGQYFSATPNKSCGGSTVTRLCAYADWSGVRPMSYLEFNKVCYGPFKPTWQGGYDDWSSIEYRNGYLANPYYGILSLSSGNTEPVVRLNNLAFTITNGNGILANNGISDINTWNANESIIFIDNTPAVDMSIQIPSGVAFLPFEPYNPFNRGFRYVRSAE